MKLVTIEGGKVVKMFIEKARGMEKDFLLFLFAGVFIGIGQSVDGSVLNNYLKENFHIAIVQRSMLEIPRELPGFLVFLIVGFLYALGDVRIAALANIAAAIGMFCLGIIPANYALMILFIFIYSTGQHVFMPLSNSIGMSFANDGRLGRKLGQLSAANTAALVISSAVLWLLFRYLHISYTVAFSIGAVAFLISSVLMFSMDVRKTGGIKNRFVFKKEYRLFYWLSVLYGARKQIFITFGPWVLVDVFRQKVTTMTILFFVISVSTIFFKPLIGYLIDKVGEKFVLAGEAAVLIFVCLGYVFADQFHGNIPLIVVFSCYVADQILNSAGMARATYLKKIAVAEEDVSPTLSAGISIDHIVSMFLPTLGGIIWYNNGQNGYKYVFFGAAVIAFINLISTMRIRIEPKEG
ncbi:MAG: MFS transporter [Clostridia bacterium]|nr:MFS transporter [Clostridia bacterium]